MANPPQKRETVTEFEFSPDETIDRFRALVERANERLLVIERHGVSVVKMPLLMAIAATGIMFFFAFPLLILLIIAGVFLNYRVKLVRQL